MLRPTPIRVSAPGDAVLGVSMGSTELPEVALAQGQRLELYRVDENITESLQERFENTFL